MREVKLKTNTDQKLNCFNTRCCNWRSLYYFATAVCNPQNPKCYRSQENLRSQHSHKNFAFSLTELLVVIAIIGIIAALLLPVLSKAKGNARRIQCVGNLHQVGVGLHNFLANNHGYPVDLDSENNDSGGMWYTQIEVNGFGISNPDYDTIYKPDGVWHCPSARWKFPGRHVSYWFNSTGIQRGSPLGLGGHQVYSTTSRTITSTPITESEVVSPADMMAIGDSFTGSQGMERKNVVDFEFAGNARERHQGKGNMLFCDGHVESPTLRFLFEDTSDEALSRWNRDHQPHREKLGQ